MERLWHTISDLNDTFFYSLSGCYIPRWNISDLEREFGFDWLKLQLLRTLFWENVKKIGTF